MECTGKRGAEQHDGKVAGLPNGALRKHKAMAAAAAAAAGEGVYRECMKNHAASLGGHALDGCGEFMPSPAADPAVPSSLSCAACGCHRNFHRRLPLHRHPRREPDELRGEDDQEQERDDGLEEGELRRSPAYSSAPHMLLALSQPVGYERPTGMAAVLPKKRFRSKFTAEQKSRMQELSEKLGWRMQKRDEGVVEERCKEIGVRKGVFKVWMHNNKHNFLGTASSRRKDMAAAAADAAGGVAGGFSGGGVGVNCGGVGGGGGGGGVVGGEGGGGGEHEGNGVEGGNEGSKESSYVMNGSSSSS